MRLSGSLTNTDLINQSKDYIVVSVSFGMLRQDSMSASGEKRYDNVQ